MKIELRCKYLQTVFILLLLSAFGTAPAQTSNYFNGFETGVGPDDWANATRVATGTNGIVSSTGSWHAEVPTPAGEFTRLGHVGGGSYNAVFPPCGFKTSLDVYLDVSGAWANDTRFHYTNAINDNLGNHRREFAFNAGFYNDAVAPGTGPRFVISTGFNTGRGSSFPKNPAFSPVVIATSGWYKFEHNFRNNGGVLAVDLTIYDPANTVVATWTLSDPTDLVGTAVGGVRYGWVLENEFSLLAIDNSSLALNSNLVTNINTGETFCTIQAAINDPQTLNGHTLQASAGTYNEGVTVNKSLTINGAQAGNCAPSRGAVSESVISNAGGAFAISAINVTIDGFTIQDQTLPNSAPGFGYAIYMVPGFTGTKILNNIVKNNIAGSSLANTGASQVVIDCNWFDANNQAGSASGNGIYTDEITGGGIVSNVLIQNNKFSNHDAFGIDFSISSAVFAATGITITSNEFTGNDRAIFLYNTNASSFSNNEVNNSSFATSGDVRIFGGVNNFTINNNNFGPSLPHAIRISDDGLGATNSNITVFENSFTGYSAANVAIERTLAGHIGVLNAECNWYGTVSQALIFAQVMGPVDFTPWLTNGTDTDVASGFQPVANCCNGTPEDNDGDGVPNEQDCDPLDPAVGARPQLNTSINGVVVNSVNDGVDDEASFAVCNTPDNIVFNYFQDANGQTGPLVKAYQVIQNTNVSVPFCNNCSAVLTAFAGTTGTASLVNPNIQGTLVMRFREFIDADGDGEVDENECAGDWVVYTVTVNPSPACVISGADPVCPNSSNVYTAPAGMSSYLWSVTGNGQISGSANSQQVTIKAGPACNQSYTLSLTVGNSYECSSTCSKTVNVGDGTKPAILLTTAATLGCNPTSAQIAAAFGTASVTDNCSTGLMATGTIGAETSAGGCYYSKTKTWMVTDACGNTGTASQKVTYKKDTEKPVISHCPSNITSCSTTVSWSAPTTSDNCGVQSLTSNYNPGASFPIGTTTVIYTAKDYCGNTGTCSFTVTVTSSSANPGTLSCAPSICVGSTTTITTNGTSGGTWSSLNTAIATVNATSGLITGVAAGTATIKYTVSNSCGSKYSTRSITVVSSTLAITCPSGSPFTRNADAACKYTVLTNEFKPAVSSSCGTAALTYTLSGATTGTGSSLNGIKLNKGTTTVTWKATVGSTVKTCSISVIVKDTKLPTITCKPGITKTVYGSATGYTVSGSELNASASDNCGTSALIYCLTGATASAYATSNTSLAGKLLKIGNTTITWKATDGSGNASTCTTVVKVIKGSTATRTSEPGNLLNAPDMKVIDPVEAPLTVKVMPNPSANAFTLVINSPGTGMVSMRVSDISGRTIELKPQIRPNGSVEVGSRYFPGTYIAEIIQGKEKVVVRLIKSPR